MADGARDAPIYDVRESDRGRVAGALSPAAITGGRGGRWSDRPVVPPAEVPEIVRQIQAAIPDDATEQAVLSELEAEPSSVLDVDYDVDGAVLAVSVRPIDADDDTLRGLTVAMSLGAAAIGLIALQRRRSLAAATTRAAR